jgi:chromosome partitioning protein
MALAQRGKSVLLVDMDPQGHLGEWFAYTSARLEKEISAVLDTKLTLPDILLPVRPRVDLAPSNIRLSYVETVLYTKYRRESRLKDALRSVQDRYDFILIDCPPSLGVLTVNALSAAGSVLIPMACEYGSLLGAGLLLQTIDEIRAEINPSLTVRGIVVTRYTRTINAREIYERAKAELGEAVHIYPETIPDTTRMREAFSLGKPLFEHDPDSPAAVAYQRLAEEVMAHG